MCNNGPAWLWLYTQYNIYMHHASLCCIVRRLSAAFCMIRLEEAYIHSTSNTKKRYSYTHCLCESFAPHASLHLMGMILTPLTTGVIYWCATRHVRWHLEEAFTPHRQWQRSTGYHWKGMIGVWGLFAWNPTQWGQSQEPWCCYGDWNNGDAIIDI